MKLVRYSKIDNNTININKYWKKFVNDDRELEEKMALKNIPTVSSIKIIHTLKYFPLNNGKNLFLTKMFSKITIKNANENKKSENVKFTPDISCPGIVNSTTALINNIQTSFLILLFHNLSLIICHQEILFIIPFLNFKIFFI